MPTDQTRTPPLRRLPRLTRPVPRETLDSYLFRLAHVNALPEADLDRLVHAGQDPLHSIASLTGIPDRVLAAAIPELTDDTDPDSCHVRAELYRAAC